LATFGKIAINFGNGRTVIQVILPQFLAKLAKTRDWVSAAKIAKKRFAAADKGLAAAMFAANSHQSSVASYQSKTNMIEAPSA